MAPQEIERLRGGHRRSPVRLDRDFPRRLRSPPATDEMMNFRQAVGKNPGADLLREMIGFRLQGLMALGAPATSAAARTQASVAA